MFNADNNHGHATEPWEGHLKGHFLNFLESFSFFGLESFWGHFKNQKRVLKQKTENTRQLGGTMIVAFPIFQKNFIRTACLRACSRSHDPLKGISGRKPYANFRTLWVRTVRSRGMTP